ncbi:hypothetical protein L218DRAFT_564864 [Marasmius fiardii PR-910]|nr:hypothetical protein L218DRAFT_564864 [Marasmius fiardii PR-910]
MFAPRARLSITDVATIMSISSCVVIIVMAALLSIHPLSKQKTDRVSFRIMICAICGIVIYLVASLLVSWVLGQTMCRVGGSLAVFGWQGASFLFFCIGLNLQLVTIHGVDGTKAEKYYLGGSVLLATLLGIITYFSKQLVYSPEWRTCYYYNPNSVTAFWWRMGIWLIWSFLAMLGELITFVSIVVYMFRVQAFDSHPRESTSQMNSSQLSASHQYRKPVGPAQYRNFVLRIALYPLSSLATSGIMVVGTLCIPPSGSGSVSDLSVSNDLATFYLSRGAVYALVAAADPAITRGVKLLYRHYVQRQTPSASGVIPAVDDHSPNRHNSGIELEERNGFENDSIRQPCSSESTSSTILPSVPRSAVLLPRRHQLDSNPNGSYVDGSRGFQTDGRIHHSYPQLRCL